MAEHTGASNGARQRRQRPRRLAAADVARAAVTQIGGLIDHDVESVIAVQRNDDDGWQVGVEVVESHRIPDSADILAIYEICLDDDGELLSYRRTRRYARGQTVGRSR
ncbi:gas vesicle protein [Mycolicibacterium goodii]|uniref:Gas vesicle protein GvpO n=1 Tax=Mycolicibacterium goodii TaxID=134601 RepID=A0A0K0XFV4_MYCGD|nr:gas vesicle protein GvpO [Mycolicibacterium goodii]